jgi:alpha-tubulin suppressor-like RCC1 family protein
MSWRCCRAQVSIVQVGCGVAHTVALSARGQVFAWGDGSCGRLGTGGAGDALQPVTVEMPDEVS